VLHVLAGATSAGGRPDLDHAAHSLGIMMNTRTRQVFSELKLSLSKWRLKALMQIGPMHVDEITAACNST
jgi:hypothetical protein